MDNNKMQYYKNKLLKEKSRVLKLIDDIREFEGIESHSMLSSELSLYDNHPADNASEFFEKEKGAALQKNEIEILNSIDDSLRYVEDGTYGKCKSCGRDIPDERLEAIPYTQYCIGCKNLQNKSMPDDYNNDPPEEDVIVAPFGYGNMDFKDYTGFDSEDSYQSVDRNNTMDRVYDYGDYSDDEDIGYVEDVEKISNAYYKSQLPD